MFWDHLAKTVRSGAGDYIWQNEEARMQDKESSRRSGSEVSGPVAQTVEHTGGIRFVLRTRSSLTIVIRHIRCDWVRHIIRDKIDNYFFGLRP
jgi:hypothetical protein